MKIVVHLVVLVARSFLIVPTHWSDIDLLMGGGTTSNIHAMLIILIRWQCFLYFVSYKIDDRLANRAK